MLRARGLAISAGLLDYRPPPAPELEQWAERYEVGGWDYLGGIDQIAQYSMIAGYIRFLGCRSILDVGCGTGLLRERLEGVDFQRYVGVDPVAVALEAANKHADDRTTLLLGDAFLPDLGQFDAVVCNEVLYCVPEPLPLIDRVQTLVAPGGYLLTSNLSHPGEGGLYKLLTERFEPVAAVKVSNRTKRGRRRRRVSVYRRA
jgi:2-polyprenyl-6-hydroxyphenyl methylase/3-demethylubiquinone-9 3-methyltransferase